MNESCPQNKTNMQIHSLAELCLQVNLSEFYVVVHACMSISCHARVKNLTLAMNLKSVNDSYQLHNL